MNKHRYNVGEHLIEIECEDGFALEEVAFSLVPFRTSDREGEVLFVMTIEEDGEEAKEERVEYRNIGDFDTGNGDVRVDKCDATGGYRFLIRDVGGEATAMMWSDSDFYHCRCRLMCKKRGIQNFAVNNALMMAYAFAGASHATLLVHASCVKVGDVGYAFLAKSGTGKSTQTGNWLKCFEDAELLNDDNPILRVKEDGIYLYGSPWSGKTPCYRNIRVRLGALTSIVRDNSNYMTEQSGAQALVSVISSCSTMRWDRKIFGELIKAASAVISNVGVYWLHCLPDEDSARICRRKLEIN